jgi:hypothetical protein
MTAQIRWIAVALSIVGGRANQQGKADLQVCAAKKLQMQQELEAAKVENASGQDRRVDRAGCDLIAENEKLKSVQPSTALAKGKR